MFTKVFHMLSSRPCLSGQEDPLGWGLKILPFLIISSHMILHQMFKKKIKGSVNGTRSGQYMMYNILCSCNKNNASHCLKKIKLELSSPVEKL